MSTHNVCFGSKIRKLGTCIRKNLQTPFLLYKSGDWGLRGYTFHGHFYLMWSTKTLEENENTRLGFSVYFQVLFYETFFRFCFLTTCANKYILNTKWRHIKTNELDSKNILINLYLFTFILHSIQGLSYRNYTDTCI